MARGKRNPRSSASISVPDGLATDDIDAFVASRHESMQRVAANLSDSDSDGISEEPEQREMNVLDIDMSDSDADDESSSELEDVEGENERKDREERLGFGGRKRDWYGGDTHEYEIMSDEEREEALKDEEEEARRLQREALERMVPEDYMEMGEGEQVEGESDTEEEGDKDTEVEHVAEEVLDVAAPEVPHLLKELKVGMKEMEVWKARLYWGEVASVMYHLYASLVVNVAFYLSLRTDPEMEGVSIREHPVLDRIVQIQEMLDDAKGLRCKEPAKGRGRVVVDEEEENENENEKKEGAGKRMNWTKGELVSGKGNGVENGVENGIGSGLANGEVNGVATADEKEGKKRRRKERKRKRKEKRKNETAAKALLEEVQADEDIVRSLLLGTTCGDEEEQEKEHEQSRKRRKLSKLVGEMERERKNAEAKQGASVDADVVREEPKAKKVSDLAMQHANGHDEADMADMEDDDEVMQKMLAKKAKKEARKARKAAESQPHVYTFKDSVDPDSKRKASFQVVKNRGLTRYRPKDKKTPRTKNRLAYSKAVVRRKGAVREYDGKPGVSYSGEASGINMAARKGSRLSNV